MFSTTSELSGIWSSDMSGYCTTCFGKPRTLCDRLTVTGFFLGSCFFVSSPFSYLSLCWSLVGDLLDGSFSSCSFLADLSEVSSLPLTSLALLSLSLQLSEEISTLEMCPYCTGGFDTFRTLCDRLTGNAFFFGFSFFVSPGFSPLCFFSNFVWVFSKVFCSCCHLLEDVSVSRCVLGAS